MAEKQTPTIALPKSWTKHVRTAMLHVFSLAQYATAYTRSWADDAGKYYLHEFMKVVEEVVPSAKVAIVGEDGVPSWGVETRTVLLGADRLVYAINVSPDPIKVSLVADGGSVVWIRGTEFKTSTDLPPLHPVLIRVRPGSASGK